MTGTSGVSFLGHLLAKTLKFKKDQDYDYNVPKLKDIDDNENYEKFSELLDKCFTLPIDFHL